MQEAARFKMVLAAIGLQQKALAEKLHYKNHTGISQMANGRVSISKQVEDYLESNYGVNIKWLRTGEGSMFNTQPTPTNPSGSSQPVPTQSWKDEAYQKSERLIETLQQQILLYRYVLEQNGINLGKLLGRKSAAVPFMLTNKKGTDLATQKVA